MFTKNELLDAIDELEMSPATYQNCEKLATFYSLFDHLYGVKAVPAVAQPVREVIIPKYGDSEFLALLEGIDAEMAWKTMDELMDAVKALQPRLYEATLQKFRDGV